MSFIDRLRAAGFDFFTGVPDSTFKALLLELESRADLGYVPAVSENVAVGVATGAHLAGRTPAVFMQNSGLALAVNALTSLALVYRIPMLLVVGWRGHDGSDSPEHSVTGPVTLPLLEVLGVPAFVPSRETVGAELARAAAAMRDASRPAALVCRPGVLA